MNNPKNDKWEPYSPKIAYLVRLTRVPVPMTQLFAFATY